MCFQRKLGLPSSRLTKAGQISVFPRKLGLLASLLTQAGQTSVFPTQAQQQARNLRELSLVFGGF